MQFRSLLKTMLASMLLVGLSVFLIFNISSGGLLKSLQWHHQHGNIARMGVWRFELPSNWYVTESNTNKIDFQRGGILPSVAGIFIAQYPTDLWAFVHQQEWQQEQKADVMRTGLSLTDFTFDLNGHRGRCIVGIRGSQYSGGCLFVEDQVVVAFNGRSGSLKEIQRILSSGRSTQS